MWQPGRWQVRTDTLFPSHARRQRAPEHVRAHASPGLTFGMQVIWAGHAVSMVAFIVLGSGQQITYNDGPWICVRLFPRD